MVGQEHTEDRTHIPPNPLQLNFNYATESDEDLGYWCVLRLLVEKNSQRTKTMPASSNVSTLDTEKGQSTYKRRPGLVRASLEPGEPGVCGRCRPNEEKVRSEWTLGRRGCSSWSGFDAETYYEGKDVSYFCNPGLAGSCPALQIRCLDPSIVKDFGAVPAGTVSHDPNFNPSRLQFHRASVEIACWSSANILLRT